MSDDLIKLGSIIALVTFFGPIFVFSVHFLLIKIFDGYTLFKTRNDWEKWLEQKGEGRG